VLKSNKIGIKVGDYAIAQNALDAEKKIIKYLENKNCILSLSVNHKAAASLIDHENHEVASSAKQLKRGRLQSWRKLNLLA